jgi:hypothetical protein
MMKKVRLSSCYLRNEEVNIVISQSEEPKILRETYIYYKKVFESDSRFINDR